MDFKETNPYPFIEPVYEKRLLYSSTKDAPHVMRFEITLKEEIDPKTLQSSLDKTCSRYPYFDVRLEKMEGEYYFVSNFEPLLVFPYEKKAALGSKENHFHQIAIDYREKVLGIDFAHHLTDGAGAYEWMKTLLYYYLSSKSGRNLKVDGVRLLGEEIPIEELSPVPTDISLPSPNKGETKEALSIPNKEFDPALYHFVLEEEAFIRKIRSFGASPNTFFAYVSGRILRKLIPDDPRPIRVAVCINERKALGLEKAHQSLVGGALISFGEEKEAMEVKERFLSIKREFKEMIGEDHILNDFSALRQLTNIISSKESDKERCEFARYIRKLANSSISATVSYVGKASFGEIEGHIEDFATITLPATGILFELSTFNGKFYCDFIMSNKDDRYPLELESILKEFYIPYRDYGYRKLDLPKIELPFEE